MLRDGGLRCQAQSRRVRCTLAGSFADVILLPYVAILACILLCTLMVGRLLRRAAATWSLSPLAGCWQANNAAGLGASKEHSKLLSCRVCTGSSQSCRSRRGTLLWLWQLRSSWMDFTGLDTLLDRVCWRYRLRWGGFLLRQFTAGNDVRSAVSQNN